MNRTSLLNHLDTWVTWSQGPQILSVTAHHKIATHASNSKKGSWRKGDKGSATEVCKSIRCPSLVKWTNPEPKQQLHYTLRHDGIDCWNTGCPRLCEIVLGHWMSQALGQKLEHAQTQSNDNITCCHTGFLKQYVNQHFQTKATTISLNVFNTS